MGKIIEKNQPPRIICPVIFLLDTSGSMNEPNGAPIGALNSAMEGVLPELASMNNNNPESEINIAVMTFDSDVKWVTGEDGLVNPEGYHWNPINANGMTSMGCAFKELKRILSVSHGFMNRASGSFAPVLFLLSDGEPTDNYKDALRELKDNNWYKVAVKAAVGYGPSYNKVVLKEFTGNEGTVLDAKDPKQLANLIQYTVITSSMVASEGDKNVGNKNGGSGTIDDEDGTQRLADKMKAEGCELATTDLDENWDD